MTNYDIAADILVKDILSGKEDISNRGVLGPMVPIRLFQALRIIGMGTSIEAMVGDGANALVYQSGQKLGAGLGAALAPKANGSLDDYISLVHDACHNLGIGEVRVSKVDLPHGEIMICVDECVSCAGIGGVHKPICNFEAGLVGGLVKSFVNRPVKAVERKCHAVGDDTCGIEVKIR